MTLTANDIIRIMKTARYREEMNKEKIIRIVNCLQQLAELDKYYWFEHMPEHEYLTQLNAIENRLNKLEQGDD